MPISLPSSIATVISSPGWMFFSLCNGTSSGMMPAPLIIALLSNCMPHPELAAHCLQWSGSRDLRWRKPLSTLTTDICSMVMLVNYRDANDKSLQSYQADTRHKMAVSNWILEKRRFTRAKISPGFHDFPEFHPTLRKPLSPAGSFHPHQELFERQREFGLKG